VVGGVLLGKKEKLASGIRERISEEDLERLRYQLSGKLFGITSSSCYGRVTERVQYPSCEGSG